MFRCRVYVKKVKRKKDLLFFTVYDFGEDGRDYVEEGELGLIVEGHDRNVLKKLVEHYKKFRIRQLKNKK